MEKDFANYNWNRVRMYRIIFWFILIIYVLFMYIFLFQSYYALFDDALYFFNNILLTLKELSRVKMDNKNYMEELEKAREQLVLRDKLLEVC